MITYPLRSLNIDEAMQLQFRLVEEITKVFSGDAILTRGDLGLAEGYNQPMTTHKVEEVLANFFHAKQAMLVRGAGTMALRLALSAVMKPNQRLLIHDAPIYPTTKSSIEMMNLTCVRVNFNDHSAVMASVQSSSADAILIQVTRQKPEDSYDLRELITAIRSIDAEVPIITDDNYAVLKTGYIGCEVGATIASFSTFKLLGPEGVGCLVGDQRYISRIKSQNYSGGLQVQGHEALDVLRGMISAPVSLAISAMVVEECCHRLNQREVTGVKRAFIANAQSKVLLVELEDPIAAAVLRIANQLGAAPHPVGAESKYEFVPMFYRLSGTFREAYPDASHSMIRINPMRAGSACVLRILQEAIQQAKEIKA
ncbi:aminotransferase (plasmid) [Entomospira entomophila]|uniref:Aminotransferase n=1 Tax=Entomospira entomophila TaxID=2719988 RepID=A0A968KWZ1_9SPIO|nr:aminotransferase class I/II-fold pyridoxal phosphate-dependent enzyme [Entomospira entomophilus]NIZ41310.1 aminotransferase [Entomospira entomophilus]WDI36167.1 aminotransferase [Entomospira entomophilus]